MVVYLILLGVAISAAASLLFSSLTYSLRDFNRTAFAEMLGRRNADKWFEPTIDRAGDLVLVTAVFRQAANIAIWVFLFALFDNPGRILLIRYGLPIVVGSVITLFTSVALAHALANYAPEWLIASTAPGLHFLRWAMTPLTALMKQLDKKVRGLIGVTDDEETDDIEQEIISAVEEGAKEGVVDEQEREMIESVIELRDTTVDQIMTPRPQVHGVELKSTLEIVKQTIEDTGHSRIPVYEDTLDHIVGVLYARDMIRLVGQPPERFDIRGMMRGVYFVPETKPTRDLLRDFRNQKVHIAVVLDEYGGTSGVVTIEDILEELVGEITDEHEPAEPPLLRRISERQAEADATIHLDELNRQMGTTLPEDDGYETLGGYLSTTLGKIPEKGTVFEQGGVRFTILDAEPRKVNRVKLELLLQPAAQDERA
jgi:putative hemolysin